MDGVFKWVKTIGSQYYDYCNNIIINNLQGIMLTGSIGDTIELDSITLRPPQKVILLLHFN